MSVFEADEPNYRFANTQFGDDLPTVAAREMGDGNRWVELVWLNRLVPPYITDDPQRAGINVLLSGAQIKIPAVTGFNPATNDGRAYERDVLLSKKKLSVTADGDLSVASGVDNLSQQLSHAVVTPRGQLTRHPDYGCLVWRLFGKTNGPTGALLGSEYVKATLAADYRVSSVESASATVAMDVIAIEARAIAIDGGAVDLAVQN